MVTCILAMPAMECLGIRRRPSSTHAAQIQVALYIPFSYNGSSDKR